MATLMKTEGGKVSTMPLAHADPKDVPAEYRHLVKDAKAAKAASEPMVEEPKKKGKGGG